MGTFDSRHPRRAHKQWKSQDRHHAAGGPLRPIFENTGSHFDKPDYKTAALCKQVRRAVTLALSGECGDPVLQELIVDDVLPAPNASRMLVRVMLRAREGGPTVIDVLQRLAAVEGMLRARVSEAIARKRTPELSFDVIPIGPSPATVLPTPSSTGPVPSESEAHHD